MKFGIKVMPREVILDTQGRAVEQTLKTLGKGVASCRVGKYIEIDVPETDPVSALGLVHEIAKTALHNPLIEAYEVEKI